MSAYGPDAVVLVGGEPSDPADVDPSIVPAGARVIAADSGLAHAAPWGLTVDEVVGDLDSVDRAQLDAAVRAGARVHEHPAAKDETDFELALAFARDAGATRVLVIGGAGRRLDHLLGNLLLLGADAWAGMEIEARIGPAHVWVVRSIAVIRGAPGDLLTLLPVGGPAVGVETAGLRYPLRGETLRAGTPRGVSNEMLDHLATVRLTGGVLLAIHPGAEP
ncbi:MAG: thiamine pyrophosphokinae [Actinomycetia bacterium]|nr:thiamine pyrophosphokinae [Actinomycetes bacterium]